jgi:hypothetical protein
VHMGEMRNACKILVGNHEGKRPLRRSRCGWGNIKMGQREMWLGVLIGFIWLSMGAGGWLL